MVWNIKDVAEWARCSPSTVRKLLKQGLPYFKVGNRFRFDPEKVKEWLEKCGV